MTYLLVRVLSKVLHTNYNALAIVPSWGLPILIALKAVVDMSAIKVTQIGEDMQVSSSGEGGHHRRSEGGGGRGTNVTSM